ncbi:hypothetical protein CXU22_12100 [Akkermansia muciniphila]|uniref:Uncharacterized protein n=1 Tax=Akkermansia muciniphila TaxID=239935 RepID=A0A2N8HBX3_9BACT|nr:hypothetical protein [Akkermansia muciniphila]PNC17347.1 hypothetical protein CXU22_12100 [Akkermansia muciniphila]
MNNAEIQIQFPQPSERDKFTLTAIYQDADSYTHTDRYTQDDIPADQAPALIAVVAALVGLAEPWQAAQVWARLGHVTALAPDEPFDPAEIEIEAVELTVEAVNAKGGRRMFTRADYPEFALTDSAAVAFFKYFTNINQ